MCGIGLDGSGKAAQKKTSLTEVSVEVPSSTQAPALAVARRVGGTAPESPGWARTQAEALPIKQLRRAVNDLFTPRPLLYWLDFAVSATCFCGGFALAAALPLNNPLKLAGAAVSVVALYRAVIFIHELSHLPPGRMPAFRLGWNLLCGIPLLAPDFLYGSHVDHHRRHAYGTASDGEYLPWGTPGQRAAIVLFLGSSFLAVPSGVLRFGVLAPLSWISPALSKWVAVSGSSLVVDMRYRRARPSPAEARRWRRWEAAVFAYLCAVAAAVAANLIAVEWVVQLYLTASVALFLNGLRTLAAHRYRAPGGALTMTEQLLDSVNHTGRPFLTELWAPVGLRFHAVHHLFPGIPYHNLPAAHARIAALLPPGSPYHRTEGHGLIASLRELWRAAGAERAAAVAGAPLRHGDGA
jgi:fatty acid desaturase